MQHRNKVQEQNSSSLNQLSTYCNVFYNNIFNISKPSSIDNLIDHGNIRVIHARSKENGGRNPRDSRDLEAARSKLAGSLHVVEQNYVEESAGQCPFLGPVALPRRHHPRLDAIIMNARFTVEPDNLTPKKKTKRKRKRTRQKREKMMKKTSTR